MIFIWSSLNVNLFNASINDGLEFPTQRFLRSESKCFFINSARYGLSTMFPLEKGLTFGKQPIKQRLLKEMFKEGPTLLRYTVTYDVKPVLDF